MSKKIIIIGGGVAGLSAGIYGQINGYDTEILEMHGTPGGQCTSWKRKGYTFDYCIQWLVGTSHGPFHNIWRETGALNKQTEVVDPDRYLTIRTPGGRQLIIYSDLKQWERYLLELAPEDKAGIHRMCGDMRRAARLEMSEKSPFQTGTLDNIRFFLRNGSAMRVFVRNGRKSVREYFDQLGFCNEVLREGLSGYTEAMEGFSAMAFILTLAWFSKKNAGYPVGGSTPLIMRMLDRYRSLGGKFSGSSRVEKIMTAGARATGVRLSDGSERDADHIIGACDLHALIYGMLDGRFVTREIEKAFEEWPLFNPVVQVSFGIDRIIETEENSCFVMAAGEKIGSTALKAGYTITNYNHDPVITPDGKCVMKLCYESPYKIWENMEQSEYRVEKERIRKDAMVLLENFYPGAKGHVEVVDVATPLTCVKYTGVWRGAYEGFLPAISNIGKYINTVLDDLDNLYLAGQWIYPGGGLPPSAQTGKWAVEALCMNEGKRFLVSEGNV